METHRVDYLTFPYSNMFPAPLWPIKDKKTCYPIKKGSNLKKIRSWYDNELAYLDSQIGQFLSSLKDMGLYNKSLIVVTSDHGELLGEHNDFGHEFWLYNELLHIPLIIKYPFKKNKEEEVIEKRVQNIDIFAELISFLEINPPMDIQGQPFNRVNHYIFSEVKKVPALATRWPKRYN